MEEATSSHSWWLLSFPFDRSSRSRPAAALEQLLLSLMYGSKHHLESSVAEAEERRLAEVNVEVEGGDDEVGWPDKEHHTVHQQQE